VEVLHDVDCVLDTLGERELPDEFRILRRGGHLVSLRGLPNGRFARRAGLSPAKRALFGIAGRKFDRMAARRDQAYDFVFVHEDGAQLSRVAELFPTERTRARPHVNAHTAGARRTGDLAVGRQHHQGPQERANL
jgi:NADPH:quinone reductase-like Zn-dependent oxidoreductase